MEEACERDCSDHWHLTDHTVVAPELLQKMEEGERHGGGRVQLDVCHTSALNMMKGIERGKADPRRYLKAALSIQPGSSVAIAHGELIHLLLDCSFDRRRMPTGVRRSKYRWYNINSKIAESMDGQGREA